MPTIKNLANFPYRIYQERWNWCIPASIEAVTKYHQPHSEITQGYVFTKIMNAGENRLGLANIKEIFQTDPNFRSWLRDDGIEYYGKFEDFSDFYSSISQFVGYDTPPIVAVPVHGVGQHMWTIVKCDENNLWYYDPSPLYFNRSLEVSPSGDSFLERIFDCAYQIRKKDDLCQLFRNGHDDHKDWTDALRLVPKK
jgi:hypothetical protein